MHVNKRLGLAIAEGKKSFLNDPRAYLCGRRVSGYCVTWR